MTTVKYHNGLYHQPCVDHKSTSYIFYNYLLPNLRLKRRRRQEGNKSSNNRRSKQKKGIYSETNVDASGRNMEQKEESTTAADENNKEKSIF